MLDSWSVQRLIHHVKKARATLILAGDDKQLSPIAAGGPFRRIADSVTSVDLKENFRQRAAPEDRQAAADIRDGNAQKALNSYAERGRLTVGEDRNDTISQMVSTWAKEGGVRSPEDAIIFTQTRRDAVSVNRMCQLERQLAGEVSDRGFTAGDNRICEGDRVLFQKPLRLYGIENGYRGTVVRVEPFARTVTVRLDREPSPQARARGQRQTVTIRVKDLGEDGASLGYAATTHKMQGQSVDKAYVLLGGSMTNQEMAYVQTTRGKQSTRLFVDELHAGEEVKDLANAMSKSRSKDLAHDVVRDPNSRYEVGLGLSLTQSRT
jgi:ATP-dependent exoDNAse (exonuclease V) alpha subunit